MPSFPHLQKFSLSPFPITTLASSTTATSTATSTTTQFVQFQFSTPRFLSKRIVAVAAASGDSSINRDQPSVVLDSLRVLQWDQLCDCVASFAGTSLGKKAVKEQLWNLDKAYEDSVRLLEETSAAVEMQKYGAMMEFSGIDVSLVESGIKCARRGFPVSGSEAMALVTLLQFADALQLNVKAAIKEDSDWFRRFMPLSEMIMELFISQPLIKFIEQLVDEDGSVKDSASSNLRHARDQVRFLGRKLYQLMESMIRNETNKTSTLEICNLDGRWCIKSGASTRPAFEGLLLARGVSVVEPLSAVPLNDELQQARASAAKAEAEVLLKITKKMQVDLDEIEHVFNIMIQIDMINARARYSLSFEGSCPDLYLQQDEDGIINAEASGEDKISTIPQPTGNKWTLYLPKAYHPLLLQRHRINLQMAMKDLSNANAEIRRRKQLRGLAKGEEEKNLNSLQMQVAKLKKVLPVPFDIFIAQNTRVLVITGPNTGGKTICLKTVGLAAMMAKSEPARIPWFDFVLADIGDEQSLSQSLSTFSGHLKQISEIRSLSTSLSLVLLDEVGAGTNPLEGAALGMSLLESFADGGALLTIATTHHGELKTLKYSNNAFENACMEFDEVNLKPTYRILWGVPGRSNAINIAERLGLPVEILDNARELYGASAEINEVIVDMERFKQDYHNKIHEAQHYMRLSRKLHQSLLLTRKRVMEHGMEERYRMMQEISEAAASARSFTHKKVRESRSVRIQPSKQIKADKDRPSSTPVHLHAPAEKNGTSPATDTACSMDNTKPSIADKKLELPKVGDLVNVPSLNKKATVLKLDLSKEELVVQAGNLKLKLKLADIVT
ncbi:UNVERIFIED_CONTAM: Endonuclease MutS2 [Sesamum angustifolium]|uniref:Endonuclease MutS2 n=1 Tax=Sesamum angustifolium TaxID=2727405 RepID=A0AAW2LJP3_9LAMI